MIVEAAGVTKPTLYYHFGSKEGLAQALVSRPLAEFLAKIRAALDECPDPVDAMAGVVRAHFTFIVEDPDRGRFFYLRPSSGRTTEPAAELEGFGERIGESFVEALRRRSTRAWLTRAGRPVRDRLPGAIVGHTMDFLYDKPGLRPVP